MSNPGEDDQDETRTGDWATPQRSGFCYYKCVTACMYYLLKRFGCSRAERKQFSFTLRRQYLRFVGAMLGKHAVYDHTMTESGLAVIDIACHQVGHAALKEQGEGRLTVGEQAKVVALLDYVAEKSTRLKRAKLKYGEHVGLRFDNTKIMYGAFTGFTAFNNMRKRNDPERNEINRFLASSKLTPSPPGAIDLTPPALIKVETLSGAVNLLNLTLALVARLEKKATPDTALSIIALIEDTVMGRLPAPAFDSTRKKPCGFWSDGAMNEDASLYAEALHSIFRLSNCYWAACWSVFNETSTAKGTQAICVSCMFAIADQIVRTELKTPAESASDNAGRRLNLVETDAAQTATWSNAMLKGMYVLRKCLAASGGWRFDFQEPGTIWAKTGDVGEVTKDTNIADMGVPQCRRSVTAYFRGVRSIATKVICLPYRNRSGATIKNAGIHRATFEGLVKPLAQGWGIYDTVPSSIDGLTKLVKNTNGKGYISKKYTRQEHIEKDILYGYAFIDAFLYAGKPKETRSHPWNALRDLSMIVKLLPGGNKPNGQQLLAEQKMSIQWLGQGHYMDSIGNSSCGKCPKMKPKVYGVKALGELAQMRSIIDLETSAADLSLYVKSSKVGRVPSEDDVLHTSNLETFGDNLPEEESEQLLSFLSAPLLRVPMMLSFFAKSRVRTLSNLKLRRLFEDALFSPGELPVDIGLVKNKIKTVPVAAKEREATMGCPYGILFNEIHYFPEPTLDPFMRLLDAGAALVVKDTLADNWEELKGCGYKCSLVGLFLFLIRVAVRVEGVVLGSVSNKFKLAAENAAKDKCKNVYLPLLKKFLRKHAKDVVTRWMSQCEADRSITGSMKTRCMARFRVHVAYLYMHAPVNAETTVDAVSEELSNLSFWMFRYPHCENSNNRTDAGNVSDVITMLNDQEAKNQPGLLLSEHELAAQVQARRLEIIRWIGALSGEDRQSVLTSVIQAQTDIAAEEPLQGWNWKEKAPIRIKNAPKLGRSGYWTSSNGLYYIDLYICNMVAVLGSVQPVPQKFISSPTYQEAFGANMPDCSNSMLAKYCHEIMLTFQGKKYAVAQWEPIEEKQTIVRFDKDQRKWVRARYDFQMVLKSHSVGQPVFEDAGETMIFNGRKYTRLKDDTTFSQNDGRKIPRVLRRMLQVNGVETKVPTNNKEMFHELYASRPQRVPISGDGNFEDRHGFCVRTYYLLRKITIEQRSVPKKNPVVPRYVEFEVMDYDGIVEAHENGHVQKIEPFVQVFEIEEKGRRAIRRLVGSSDQRKALHEIDVKARGEIESYPPATLDFYSMSREAAEALQVPFIGSQVIERIGENGWERLIAADSLRGLLPDFLIDEFQFYLQFDVGEDGKKVIVGTPRPSSKLEYKLHITFRPEQNGDAVDVIRATRTGKRERLVNLHRSNTSTSLRLLHMLSLTESLGYVLCWTDASPTTESECCPLSSIELPRLQITLKPKLLSTSAINNYGKCVVKKEWKLFVQEHSRLFLTDLRTFRGNIDALRAHMQGMHHGMLLQDKDDNAFVLVPNYFLSRPKYKTEPFSKRVFPQRQRYHRWFRAVGKRYYLYGLHTSGAYLTSPSILGTMQLMLTRMLNRDYDAAMVFAEKCHINLGGDDGSKGSKSDQKARRELEWIYSQIAPTKDDDKDPDAHATRLKLFLLSEESRSEFGDKNMVEGDLNAIGLKRPHLSVCTRLTREEEVHILHYLEDPDHPYEENVRPHSVYRRGGGGAVFEQVAQWSMDNMKRMQSHVFFDRARLLKNADGTQALKLMIAMTNDDGFADSASRAHGGFLFLYAVIVGEVKVTVAGNDYSSIFAKLVLHWIASFLEVNQTEKNLIKVLHIMLRLRTEGALESISPNFPSVPNALMLSKDYPFKRGDHRHYGEDGAINFYTYFFKPHEKWMNSPWYTQLLASLQSATSNSIVKKSAVTFASGCVERRDRIW